MRCIPHGMWRDDRMTHPRRASRITLVVIARFLNHQQLSPTNWAQTWVGDSHRTSLLVRNVGPMVSSIPDRGFSPFYKRDPQQFQTTKQQTTIDRTWWYANRITFDEFWGNFWLKTGTLGPRSFEYWCRIQRVALKQQNCGDLKFNRYTLGFIGSLVKWYWLYTNWWYLHRLEPLRWLHFLHMRDM